MWWLILRTFFSSFLENLLLFVTRRTRERVETVSEENVGNASEGIDFQEPLPKINMTHHKEVPEQSEDRISELPDSLLVEILSLLPMEDSVRTGILRKRWKGLWTHVDKIRYHFAFGMDSQHFTSFVDHTLKQCTCAKLKEFSLHLRPAHSNNHLIEEWLRYVCSKNVEFLQLEWFEKYYTPPEWFYHISSLKKLELWNWSSTRLGQVSWVSLKSLLLAYVDINDNQLASILLGCPVLHTFTLNNVTTFNHLKITSPRLMNLKVLDFTEVEFLEIHAPFLQELEISGSFFSSECRLVDVSSLVCAKLTFVHCPVDYFGYENDRVSLLLDMAVQVLEQVHHVEELIFGPIFIRALSTMEVLGRPSPLLKCKKLTVQSTMLEYELPGIISLLKSSPHLEILVLQVVNPAERTEFNQFDFSDHLYEIFDATGDEYLSLQEQNFLHLKKIKVVFGVNLCYCDEVESRNSYEVESRDSKCYVFELMAYILKTARLLERPVLTTEKDNFCGCELSDLSHKVLHMCFDGNVDIKWGFKKQKFECAFNFSHLYS